MDEQGQLLINSLKKQFPNLQIEFINGTICVEMQGFWCGIAEKTNSGWEVNEDLKAVIPNYVIFKELEGDLLSKDSTLHGAYLLVNSETSRFIYETHDAAWRDKKSLGFLVV